MGVNPLTPEGQIKKDIDAYLDSVPGLFHYRAPGGAYGRPGIPDIIICYKGRFVGMEVKTPEGRVSGFQKTVGAEIEGCGGVWVVVRSVEDAMDAIEAL